MTKIKYAILNGGNIIAKLWEDENGKQVLIPSSEILLDINYDLEVCDEDGDVKHYIDLRQFFLDLIEQAKNQ
jgi:hypothetical protein